MTILDLPKLTPIEFHLLGTKPLENSFSTMIQATDFYKETRHFKFEWWTKHENKLAYFLKFNSNSVIIIKDSAIEKYGQVTIDNANKYLNSIVRRSNIQPVALQYAAIAWFIEQMVDIAKTKEANKFQWEVATAK